MAAALKMILSEKDGDPPDFSRIDWGTPDNDIPDSPDSYDTVLSNILDFAGRLVADLTWDEGYKYSLADLDSDFLLDEWEDDYGEDAPVSIVTLVDYDGYNFTAALWDDLRLNGNAPEDFPEWNADLLLSEECYRLLNENPQFKASLLGGDFSVWWIDSRLVVVMIRSRGA